MFQPALSWSTVRVWCPAGRVTVAVTVAQVLPAAGGGDVDVAAQVGAGAVGDVQAVGDPAGRGQPQADGVGAGGGDVDGVLEPLPGRGPAQVVAAAGVGGGFQVHAVGAVAVGGAVDRGDVVGHALPAGVVVLRLHGAGDRRRGAAVRAFPAGGGVDAPPVNGSKAWLKNHVGWVMPEQLPGPLVPGQPPLSRSSAQNDS